MICIFASEAREIKYLIKKLEIISEKNIGKMTIRTAKLNEKELLLVETGYGKVNIGAAMGTVYGMYQIDTIIGVGDCASMEKKEIDINNIAISSKSLQHDVDFSAIGYNSPLIVGVSRTDFPADKGLIKLARKQSKLMNMPFIQGVFGSGDSFIASDKKKHKLGQQYEIDFIDCECGNIGEFAFEYEIPYVCVKGVSNYADSEGGNMYYEYRSKADSAACKVVYKMLCILTSDIPKCDCPGTEEINGIMELDNYLQLTQATIKQLIPTFKYASLCVAENNQPYCVPIGFSYHEQDEKNIFCLYSHLQGQKMHCMQNNSKVCLILSRYENKDVVSVVVTGTVEIDETLREISCNNNLVAIKLTAQEMTGRRYHACCPYIAASTENDTEI